MCNNNLNTMFWRIKDFYLSLRCWFRHCFNRRKFRTIGSAIKAYPFDHSCYLPVLKNYLKEQLYYFEHTQIIDGTRNVQKIKLALSLLEILMEERELYTSNIRQVNEIKDGSMPIRFDLKVNVNTRNAERFNCKDIDNNLYKIELYCRKANYLFYRCLEQYSREWWD